MRAVVVQRFGGPEQLEASEVPDPKPGPGEVLVRVAAADVLFLETMIRAGDAPEGMAPQLPWVPGGGVAGEVVAVGSDADAGWLGALAAGHTGRAGGYAEYAVAPAAALLRVPDGVSAQSAAALLHDGATAVGLIERTGVTGEDAVLVLGASGGLGLVLVQLARARAGRVVAVARDRRKLERIRALGPDAVVDSEAGDWVMAARDALGGAATVILDNVGGRLGERAFAGLLADGGRFSAHGTPSGAFAAIDRTAAAARNQTVTGIEAVQFSAEALHAYTAQALAAAASGVIAPVVGQTFPLARAADAHAAIAARTVFGKTLLTP